MNNLRYIRKTKTQLTMKQLGEMVGVTESAISNYESGKRQPDYEMLLKLSEVLGCSVADIMENAEPETDTYSDLKEELQILRDNPNTRTVLKGMKGMTPEQVLTLGEFIKTMKGNQDAD